ARGAVQPAGRDSLFILPGMLQIWQQRQCCLGCTNTTGTPYPSLTRAAEALKIFLKYFYHYKTAPLTLPCTWPISSRRLQ
uniref:Uncharacterized protein n=1 Tax=Zonotrichia albicollis TaxID=44394 RepID=A0A8D2ME14_ZONAL